MAIAEGGLKPIIAGSPVGHEVLNYSVRIVGPEYGGVNGWKFSVLQRYEADLSPFIPAYFAVGSGVLVEENVPAEGGFALKMINGEEVAKVVVMCKFFVDDFQLFKVDGFPFLRIDALIRAGNAVKTISGDQCSAAQFIAANQPIRRAEGIKRIHDGLQLGDFGELHEGAR